VLIVDDEPAIRQIMKKWIGDAGYEFREAADADEALRVMAAGPAAVVFCDVQMPGRDGLWLTAELRKLYPTTAVVLATGVSTVPPKVSMQAGVLAYLVKPFQRGSLLDALEQALDWHKETVEAGPRPEDSGDSLTEWLDKLDEF
jgi:DNA-binding NtrC family response regulator